MLNVLQLTKELINLPSVTPEGAECIDKLITLLQPLGFVITRTSDGPATNLWARYGTAAPLVCFLGHVDVVPPGPLAEWQHDPFQANEKDGYLYGRGACDMKSGVAAMAVAAHDFIKNNPHFTGSIALLITTAEEDLDQFGVPTMIELLKERGEKIDYCITGEPSSTNVVGDVIRPGRRGSLSAQLTVHGKQGHVAFPHLADNPLNKMLAPLAELAAVTWDQGSADFPPTSLQFSNINAGTGAHNVIPGSATIKFNFRFSPAVTVDYLKETTEAILNKHQLKYQLDWQLSGLPFLTPGGDLIDTVKNAVHSVMKITPTLSTGGGTSDARFIAPLGAQVIELGVCNATAHKINECVKISDLENLVRIYRKILEQLLDRNYGT
jgi:succinyl-diaminopimelate desuccinylase